MAIGIVAAVDLFLESPHRWLHVIVDLCLIGLRQHSIAVYRKSGLAGRAELSAFFLEDLLAPSEAPASGPERADGQRVSRT